MVNRETAGSQLIAQIHSEFIEIVGPIGELLIDDARRLWRRKGWRGPSALRHYINALADNIEQPSARKRFMDKTSQLVYDARLSR